jgi:predicted nuclease with TOPRIM domain
MSEQPPVKATRSYPEILQLNQELVKNLQGLIDEDEGRKKELEQLKTTYAQAKAEIARLQEDLRRSKEREADRQEDLKQLEQERIDQLGAMGAHLDAMQSAVQRYLKQGRKAA